MTKITSNNKFTSQVSETPFEPLRHVRMERYITPLREGGSLPGLAEASDGFKYVLKFGGGGHGAKALISEYIGGMIARAAGLRVPELVLADVDENFGRTEPDEEVRQLLEASKGLNLGLHFLNGSYAWDVAVDRADAVEASSIVWLDAYITNVDRTFRNTNMLLWNGQLWLIDHGSCLIFHHNWIGWEKSALSPFPYIKDHALLPQASRLKEADDLMRQRITPEFIRSLVKSIPEEWLISAAPEISPEEQRDVYLRFLLTRLENSQIFTDHAIATRKTLI